MHLSHETFANAEKARVLLPDAADQKILPFLKWAGGKRWLMPMAQALRDAPIQHYFEPFLGSGAMFFGISPRLATLSDSNISLIETYQAIKDDWRSVERELRAHDRKHCAEHYYRVRDAKPRAAHKKAARFVYLNRTCWNGLYRVNRAGQFNTPIGSKKRAVLSSDNFELIAASLANATLVSGDFQAQIDSASSGDLIFADPPYTVRHQYNGFIKYNEDLFSWDDQERLCKALQRAKERGAKIICTNADHKSIRELYGKHFTVTPVSRFSAIAGAGGTRGTYAEVIIQ